VLVYLLVAYKKGRYTEKPLQSDKIFIKIHMTAYLMINLFYIEAGWPGLMA
jgi:hypothetical protein